jgi:8-oxo-dGTP diphosphatase
VVLVHRPRYDDWTIPKGKVLLGEPDEDAAVREVGEETGLVCELGPELGRLHYRDRKDRTKVTRFWAMTPIGGSVRASHEIDEVAWTPMAEAACKLTRSGERGFIHGLINRGDDLCRLSLATGPHNLLIAYERTPQPILRSGVVQPGGEFRSLSSGACMERGG